MGVDVECVVVGAGVVGLATARALAQRGREVLVLEANAGVGQETSSRNSEVVHAGLYYEPGSLKARFCIEGNRLLKSFAAENGVALRRCGKLLVAVSEEDERKLAAIAANAATCGAEPLTRLTREDVRALEPEIHCRSGFLAPASAVIDTHGLMVALEGHIGAAGGRVQLDTRVTELGMDAQGTFQLDCQSSDGLFVLTAREVVIAAGHGAADLAARLPAREGYNVPRLHWAKGHYFSLHGPPPFSHLVYPVPSGGSLGIHYTLDTGGGAKFGPDISWVSAPSYAFDDPDGERRRAFERSIRAYWPALPDDALSPGYTGVRPKLSGPGEPQTDFAISGPREHGISRLVSLVGIDSPGLTSSLAIANHVADLLA